MTKSKKEDLSLEFLYSKLGQVTYNLEIYKTAVEHLKTDYDRLLTEIDKREKEGKSGDGKKQ